MKRFVFEVLVLIDWVRILYQKKVKKKIKGTFYMNKPLSIVPCIEIENVELIFRTEPEIFLEIDNAEKDCKVKYHVTTCAERHGNKCSIDYLYWEKL